MTKTCAQAYHCRRCNTSNTYTDFRSHINYLHKRATFEEKTAMKALCESPCSHCDLPRYKKPARAKVTVAGFKSDEPKKTRDPPMARPEDEFKTVFRPETSSNDISFKVSKISGRDWAKLEPDELAVIKDNWIKVLDSNGLQFQTTDGKVDSLYKSFLMLHECLEPESYEISRLKATAKM